MLAHSLVRSFSHELTLIRQRFYYQRVSNDTNSFIISSSVCLIFEFFLVVAAVIVIIVVVVIEKHDMTWHDMKLMCVLHVAHTQNINETSTICLALLAAVGLVGWLVEIIKPTRGWKRWRPHAELLNNIVSFSVRLSFSLSFFGFFFFFFDKLIHSNVFLYAFHCVVKIHENASK